MKLPYPRLKLVVAIALPALWGLTKIKITAPWYLREISLPCHRRFLEWILIWNNRHSGRPYIEDMPIAIALQSILDGVYDRSRYHARIDYTQPPPAPALPAPDQDWLKAHLQEQEVL